jgi:hypothetical protein
MELKKYLPPAKDIRENAKSIVLDNILIIIVNYNNFGLVCQGNVDRYKRNVIM